MTKGKITLTIDEDLVEVLPAESQDHEETVVVRKRYFVGAMYGLLIGELDFTSFVTYEECIEFLKSLDAPNPDDDWNYLILYLTDEGELEVQRTLTWSYFDFHEEGEEWDIWDEEDGDA